MREKTRFINVCLNEDIYKLLKKQKKILQRNHPKTSISFGDTILNLLAKEKIRHILENEGMDE